MSLEAPAAPELEGSSKEDQLNQLKGEFEKLDTEKLKAVVDKDFAEEKGIDTLSEAPTAQADLTDEEYKQLAQEVLNSRE